MKKFTRILQVMIVLLLSSSFVFAQSLGTAKQAAKDNQVKKEMVSPADRSPETVKTVVPSSNTDALYDLVWKVNTHGYPTAYNEAGIETDGSYIYSTRWNTAGAFFRYTMAGAFVDGFSISGAGAIRDLAYDPAVGRMYGGAGATTVYEMNFTTYTLVSSFVAPTAVRAIAWDPDLNIFYANNWSTAIYKFTKAGASQGSFPCGPAGVSYYGFAYCPVGTCGGPLLYGYAQTGVSPYNYMVEIALPSGTETGNNLDITSLIGATTGTAGGLAFYTDIPSNKWVVLGLSQNEWIFTLEVCPAGAQQTNDVGVAAIVTPVSGWNLGAAEPVKITVHNYGTASQSNIPVYFTLDGGAQQTGTVPGPLASGANVDFTFTQTVNLSTPGQTYTIVACTNMTSPLDENPANDCKTASVQNQTGTYCAAGATYCDEYIDNVQLGTINNSSGCGLVGGYSDYTAISTVLQASTPYTIIVHNPVPYTGDVVDCWIDYAQDNWDAGDLITTTSSDMMTFTSAAFTLPGTAINGNTRFRTRIYYYPTAADPCGTSTYGEVEDYTVNLQIVQYPNDVGTQSIDAPVGMGNLAPVTPLATVRNYGTAAQTFPVNMTIGSYTSTKTVNNLAPGATQQVTFDTWTPPGAGSYTITVCTQLVPDAVPSNDCKTGGCSFMEDRQVYGYNAYDPSGALVEGPVTFQLITPGTLNLLAPTSSADFIACGTWVTGDRWIGCQYGGGYYEIDETNGAMTYLAASGAGGMTGLSYCWDDDLMYAVYYNGTNMDWYSVNPTTLAETFIANMGGSHLFINLAYNDITDMFYAIDIVDDALYSINKATGAPTLVGPTNLSMNYAQDMEVDNNNGIMYAAAYTTTGQLCLIDQVTGGGTVIGNFAGGAEICGFAIPYTPFTGISLDIDIWFEGPYDAALDGGMHTYLNPTWIPLTQPFGSNLYNPTPCWYYTGSEAVAAVPAGVVDWVLVELRDGGTTGAFTVAKQALFVNSTGKIVALDGTSVPIFGITVTGPLYVVVYHRNHQAVMSSAGAIGSGTNYSWNFKTGSGQYYGGVNGAKQLEVGAWGARAGDGNADKQTNNDDKLVVWKPESGTSGYKAGDYNLDAQVNNSDKIDRWKPNSGTASQVPN
jgi:hypothetical protein